MDTSDPQTNFTKVFLLILVAVAIFAGLVILFKNQSKDLKNTSQITPSSIPSPPSAKNSIDISEDHYKPGTSITVSKVTLEKGGYIGVMKLDKRFLDDEGLAIGKSEKLPVGESTNVTINLSEAVVDGDILSVFLIDPDDIAMEEADGSYVQVQKPIRSE